MDDDDSGDVASSCFWRPSFAGADHIIPTRGRQWEHLSVRRREQSKIEIVAFTGPVRTTWASPRTACILHISSALTYGVQ
jgi:hypothetical protein